MGDILTDTLRQLSLLFLSALQPPYLCLLCVRLSYCLVRRVSVKPGVVFLNLFLFPQLPFFFFLIAR
jgi:hypothetical protein